MQDTLVGSYLLLLKVTDVSKIKIGKLGELSIKPGFYVYSGSAFGPGGVSARVGRHLRRVKKLRWHIDYLRQRVENACAFIQPNSRSECTYASELIISGGEVAMKGFGSSDCRCKSHLIYFTNLAPIKRFVSDHKMTEFHI